MEDINWISACEICQQNADAVNKEAGRDIVYNGPKEITKTIEVAKGSNMSQTVAISLGFCLIALVIVIYILWSRFHAIIEATLNKEVERRLDDAVKNFTYEAQNDIVKNIVTIRVVRK